MRSSGYVTFVLLLVFGLLVGSTGGALGQAPSESPSLSPEPTLAESPSVSPEFRERGIAVHLGGAHSTPRGTPKPR